MLLKIIGKFISRGDCKTSTLEKYVVLFPCFYQCSDDNNPDPDSAIERIIQD